MKDTPNKPPRIGAKIRAAIELVASRKARTYTEAAEMAGVSREHLSRSLRLPHVATALLRRTEQLMAAGALPAGACMVALINGASARVAFEAAKHTLAIANIRPPADGGANINIGISAGQVIGYTIDLSDPRTGRFDAEPTPDTSGADRRALLIERGLITDAEYSVSPSSPAPLDDGRAVWEKQRLAGKDDR